MSLLFPIFLAGAAFIAIPVLLHLARKRTGKEIPFGSLMFLSQTPPRFERRRRVEHLALLALRALALALVAAAFARPFLSRPMPALATVGGTRTVILLDRSASMRRESLWADAVSEVRELAERAGPGDAIAILTFARGTEVLIGFEDWRALAPGARAGAVAARLSAAAPGWEATDLGRALVTAADLLADEPQEAAARKVIVVGDLQKGSRLEAQAAAVWPPGVALVFAPAVAEGKTNATAQALGTGGEGPVRVRVTNAAGGERERFTVRWDDDPRTVEVAVPAGHARVVELPAPHRGAAHLVVSGDDHDFDNRIAVAGPVAARVKVVHLGAGDDARPDGPYYFLSRAFPETPLRQTEIVSRPADDARAAALLEGAHLVVVTGALSPALADGLKPHLARGRTVLVALGDARAVAALGALGGGGTIAATEANGKDYAILTSIDFGHPVLAPLADPLFGDFTKIRYWKHRLVDERAWPGARVVARFDDGAPAWAILPAGKGSIFLMASGWHPADSQLALSSKFVPVLHAILESSAGLTSGQAQFHVGDAVPLPPGGGRTVRRPDGKVVEVADDTAVFSGTELPGIYTLGGPGEPRAFAVNLAPAESDTAPLPPETLDRLAGPSEAMQEGAGATTAPAPAAIAARVEAEQKGWRWLILAALALLAAESMLGGRLARRPKEAT